MATRGKTTFQKRQKEMARKERQQQKVERRDQRRIARSIEAKMPPQDAADGESDSRSESPEAAEQISSQNRGADWYGNSR